MNEKNIDHNFNFWWSSRIVHFFQWIWAWRCLWISNVVSCSLEYFTICSILNYYSNICDFYETAAFNFVHYYNFHNIWWILLLLNIAKLCRWQKRPDFYWHSNISIVGRTTAGWNSVFIKTKKKRGIARRFHLIAGGWPLSKLLNVVMQKAQVNFLEKAPY